MQAVDFELVETFFHGSKCARLNEGMHSRQVGLMLKSIEWRVSGRQNSQICLRVPVEKLKGKGTRREVEGEC